MAASTKKNQPEENNEQLEMNFPSPDDFESYDEVDAAEGQAEMPADSFSEADANFDAEGCGCA